MIIELESYQAFMVLSGILGGVVGMIKIMGNQINKNIQQNFESTNLKIENVARQAAEGQKEIRALERQFLEFKADMPFRYIARDDYIRGQTVLEAKVDSIAQKLENVQIIQGMQK
ncbi:hypothetical protein I9054_012275 [Acinetobacter bereziniae]|uniref:Uncharacterized protein n=1 Tax=Acinetobacter bereziniae TaxID=106648 RepID=A0A8I1AIY2_ACIBZ|nr:hypothetical protein [Acinetobacter bereziniae]QQC83011.1 hypothetical protein I9190_11855 [Acinetobacter bereziniae]UUN96160.1 hypothetical protein I9054_012275 [Acinetobacter bereziniae]